MEATPGKLVVIIPALNEAKTIGQVIAQIPKTMSGVSAIEVLVVNDGSSDDTEIIAKNAGAKVVNHSTSRGVGSAFHTGIIHALRMGADLIVNIDSDGQFDPQDIPKLLQPIIVGRAEFVITSRFAKAEFIPTMPALKKWGNNIVTRMVNFITGQKFTDVSCGFRAYTRDVAMRLTLFGRFTYTQETLIDAVFKDIEIMEVPLKIRGEREHGKSRVASNLWRYAIKSASIMFLAARDYKPFYFFGLPGIILFIIGTFASLFLLVHYISTGQTAPYRSLVSLSGQTLIIGSLLLFISMLADMMHRNRIIQEKTLYLVRKAVYGKGLQQ